MPNPDKYFPADSYRKHQKKATEVILNKLEEPGIKNIIVIAPTGFGKSAVNIAAGRYSGSTFYVTPQKQLRQQLVNDDLTGNYVDALKARADYTCVASGKDCSNCPVRRDEDRSCLDTPGCTYWNAKEDAMQSPIAALTFAYLVVDNYLPDEVPGHGQVSFKDRDLIIVDEGHSLEEDTASMFAGTNLTPRTVPQGIYADWVRDLDQYSRSSDLNGEGSFKLGQVIEVFEELRDTLKSYIDQNSTWGDPNPTKEVEKCRKIYEKINYAVESTKSGKEWVVNKDMTEHQNRMWTTYELKPVNVAPFLERNIWSRADKRIVSTATAPYRDNIDKWCYRIGLDPEDTFVMFVPMEFPVENRPIHTDTIVDKMSGGTDEERIDDIMDTLSDITAKHKGEKGLVHTSSYERAEMIYEESFDWPVLEDNVMMQHRDSDKEKLLEDWQDEDMQLLLSPSMEEGVDLVDDQCRFQALVKVPYPSPNDARVEAIQDKPGGWDWYFETTALKICQSYGRAVRSEEDYADYYVLDESFNDIRRNVKLPDWVKEAIQ